MKFSNVIKIAEECPAFYPRTAVDYKIGGLVVFQFVKSTKNVWVDRIFSNLIDDKELFEKELIKHFGKVKTVYFDLDINGANEEFKNKIKDIVNKFGSLNN